MSVMKSALFPEFVSTLVGSGDFPEHVTFLWLMLQEMEYTSDHSAGQSRLWVCIRHC